MYEFREYDAGRDADATLRIWKECGWIDDDDQRPAFELALNACRASVADINDTAECLVTTIPGSMRYLAREVPFALVYGVTTSRVARKQGFASRLTAHRIADDAAQGAIVSALGAFELGFYDRLGFGTGTYEHMFEVDPARLRIPGNVCARPPRRLTLEHAEAMHANRTTRRRGHGACNLPLEVTKAEVMYDEKKCFGLGYFDGPDGALTHHFWCRSAGEYGPYRVYWLAYETETQLLELLAVLAGLGDQVRQLRIMEPPGVPLINFVEQPIRAKFMSKGAAFAQDYWFLPWWQMRMNDVAACLEPMRLPGTSVRFNLELTDPIESLLPADASWRGVAGNYVVSLGPASGAEPGRDDTRPTLRASVNAFTRLWLGVRPASDLAFVKEIDAPPDLIATLDEVVRLPQPNPDWDF